MFSVGSSIIWLRGGERWSGVVEKLANYGGKDVAHCSWDGIVVPPAYECGKPMPKTPYPHVPVSELLPREQNADDNKRKALRIEAIQQYNAQQRQRFVGVKPGTPVTWVEPDTLNQCKGKIVQLIPGDDYALVEEWGRESMPVLLMNIQII